MSFISEFEQSYRCCAVSFLEKPYLENGDKVIMPPSALGRLAYLEIDYPMLFQVSNPSSGKISHCGVMEFIADEGLIYLPYWMMENMLLQEGDIVNIKSASLPKGTFVKLQPHTKDFLDVSNPRAILETTLRSYSCLTTGDTIMVPYNKKNFYIDIVETKPSSAVSIFETDCEVDFAPPLDYKEPEKLPTSSPLNKRQPEVEDDSANKSSKFDPFTGSSRRLNGKPASESVAPISSPLLRQHKPEANNGTNGSMLSSPPSRKHSGKLVFGSDGDQDSPRTPEKETTPEDSRKEQLHKKASEPKFQAFTGKKYSLKG